MHEHMSLRERLEALRKHGEPEFTASGDPILVSFAQLFDDSGMYSFDANKHLRTDALSPIYDCWTESRRESDSDPEKFVVIWTPVWERNDPVTGFRTGQDSVFVGSTPTVAMPQDERTAALLLLVTSTFVHLSAVREGSGTLVQAAIETGDNDFSFVTLDPALVVGAHPAGADQIS
jgi:hypothetical protein